MKAAELPISHLLTPFADIHEQPYDGIPVGMGGEFEKAGRSPPPYHGVNGAAKAATQSDWGVAKRAPAARMRSLAACTRVKICLPWCRSSRQRASVLLPGAAWATKMSFASAPTNRLRCSVRSRVGRRCLAPKGDRTSSRLSASGCPQLAGKRIRSMLRAGQMTMGCWPRSSRARHSCSMGE